MTMRKRWWMGGVMVCLAAVFMETVRAEDQRVTVAVLELMAAGEVQEYLASGEVRSWLGTFKTILLTDQLIAQLVRSRKFHVVERIRVEEVLKEAEFGQSGAVDPQKAVKYGTLLGADYLVLGTISVLRFDTEFSDIPYTKKVKREEIGKMIVDLRLVDAHTGKIQHVVKGDIDHRVQKILNGRNDDPLPPEFADELLREMAEQLTVEIVNRVYPVKVLSVEKGVVFLNRGEGGGLSVGDEVEVFQMGEELVDEDTGISLGRTEAPVATLRVTEVLNKFTKAEVVSEGETVEIPKGAICRKREGKKKSAPSERPARKKLPD
jgi:TolB-like protein